MSKEKIKSIVRAILQVVGVLIAFTDIPFVGQINEALEYLLGQMDGVWQGVEVIIGVGLTLFGFFKDPERHEDRENGIEVKKAAAIGGVSVKAYIQKNRI
jgi:hypothetical protein